MDTSSDIGLSHVSASARSPFTTIYAAPFLRSISAGALVNCEKIKKETRTASIGTKFSAPYPRCGVRSKNTKSDTNVLNMFGNSQKKDSKFKTFIRKLFKRKPKSKVIIKSPQIVEENGEFYEYYYDDESDAVADESNQKSMPDLKYYSALQFLNNSTKELNVS